MLKAMIVLAATVISGLILFSFSCFAYDHIRWKPGTLVDPNKYEEPPTMYTHAPNPSKVADKIDVIGWWANEIGKNVQLDKAQKTMREAAKEASATGGEGELFDLVSYHNGHHEANGSKDPIFYVPVPVGEGGLNQTAYFYMTRGTLNATHIPEGDEELAHALVYADGDGNLTYVKSDLLEGMENLDPQLQKEYESQWREDQAYNKQKKDLETEIADANRKADEARLKALHEQEEKTNKARQDEIAERKKRNAEAKEMQELRDKGIKTQEEQKEYDALIEKAEKISSTGHYFCDIECPVIGNGPKDWVAKAKEDLRANTFLGQYKFEKQADGTTAVFTFDKAEPLATIKPGAWSDKLQ